MFSDGFCHCELIFFLAFNIYVYICTFNILSIMYYREILLSIFWVFTVCYVCMSIYFPIFEEISGSFH